MPGETYGTPVVEQVEVQWVITDALAACETRAQVRAVAASLTNPTAWERGLVNARWQELPAGS